MSISIASLRIADPETRDRIKRGIEAISAEFPGDWSLSVIDSSDNDAWAIKLTGPSGFRHIRMLSAYQQAVPAVQKVLRELREAEGYPPSDKEKIDLAAADLRERGHTVRAIIYTDNRMWFEIDQRMLASWEEMEALADGLSLEELEAMYVIRSKRERTGASRADLPPQAPRVPFLTSLRLDSLLSFAPESEPIKLTPLNLLIGPNGSGKSNLIEALELLHAAPSGLTNAISQGGGAREWLWKGDEANGNAKIEATLSGALGPIGIPDLRYRLCFTAAGDRTEVTEEAIEKVERDLPSGNIFSYYNFQGGNPVILVKESEKTGGEDRIERHLLPKSLPPGESVLSQRKDPDLYPELTWLGRQFGALQVFGEWIFGRNAPVRRPQPADLPGDVLLPDSRNLGVILQQLEHTDSGPEFNRLLSRFLPRYERFSIEVKGNTVQFFLQEQGLRTRVPANRLSDGTLRFLAMLALLLTPVPPPLTCIEEPELGLHPDALPLLANLLIEASSRSQFIVTTHSDVLVSALTDHADSVLICDYNGGTTIRRVESLKLRHWLDRYRLGEIWRIGEIGGNP